MLGAGFTIIVIVELVNGQAPLFVILHCNTFVPSPTAVNVVLGLFTFAIVAEPLITDHAPVPTLGVLAASVTVVNPQVALSV